MPGVKVVALGNTASVMSTISEFFPNLKVGCAPIPNSTVIQVNDNCFSIPGTNVSSVSWVKLIRSLGKGHAVFHAELPYASACMRAEVPYGVHIHGTTDAQLLFPRTRAGSLMKYHFMNGLREASYVVCHRMLLDDVRRLRPDAEELESPIDMEQFSPGGPAVRLARETSMLVPGRVDQWKGHRVIWEALRMMKNRDHVRAFQVSWGCEPYFSEQRRKAPPCVSFIPVVPRGEIAPYYRGADVVIGQMQLGFLGMAELEAAACGSPVTAYSKDPETPFLPKHPDPAELASLLDRLTDDRKFREDYSSSCREYVLNHHNAERVALKLASIVRTARAVPYGMPKPRDLMLWEIGTGLEIAEAILGGPARLIRKRLLEA